MVLPTLGKMYKILSLLWPTYFDRKIVAIGNKSQIRDKVLYILLAFVFYSYNATYIADH